MLTEKTILQSVTVLLEAQAIEVRWDCKVLRNEGTEQEELVSSTPHRKAYGRDMVAELRDEVPNAASYLVALGW